MTSIISIITAQECNNLALQSFAARLPQAKLASKNDIDDFVKTTNFDDKLKNLNKKATSNKGKHAGTKKKLH